MSRKNKQQWHPMTIEVYRFIHDFMMEEDFAPTLREISEGVFIASSSVYVHLGKLEGWGYIEREPGKARGMRLTDKRPYFMQPQHHDP